MTEFIMQIINEKWEQISKKVTIEEKIGVIRKVIAGKMGMSNVIQGVEDVGIGFAIQKAYENDENEPLNLAKISYTSKGICDTSLKKTD